MPSEMTFDSSLVFKGMPWLNMFLIKPVSSLGLKLLANELNLLRREPLLCLGRFIFFSKSQIRAPEEFSEASDLAGFAVEQAHNTIKQMLAMIILNMCMKRSLCCLIFERLRTRDAR